MPCAAWCAPSRLGLGVEQAAERTGVPLVVGSSLNALLDVDWDDPAQKQQALTRLLDQVHALDAFLRREMRDALATPRSRHMDTVQQILRQDLEPDPERGGSRIRLGVSPERRISIRDGEMRHGRKSKSARFDGFSVTSGSTLTPG